MDQPQIEESARIVAEHRLRRLPLPPLMHARRVDDGYRVQQAVRSILERELGPVAGHKIGATNPAIQAKLGVGHPCAGCIYANTVWRSGATLRVCDFQRPGLECEMAFRLGRDLPPRSGEYQLAEVEQAIDACMASMEIVDNRHQDLAHVHVPTLIADDTLDAGVVLGAPITDWRDLDLPRLTGTIRRDGIEISRAAASSVLGSPLHAMLWIANTYSRLGWTLRAGEFVSTGSIADLIWVKPGEHYAIEVEALGTLEVRFD